MAEYTEKQHLTTIRCFEPDDDDNTMHLQGAQSLSEIIDAARAKWGEGISLDDISITPEHIHTRCLGYDKYDPADWTDFLVVTKDSN